MRYYIMMIYQTGNIGPHNIKISDNQPDDGFETYEEAEEYLLKDINRHKYHEWHKVTILKLY